MNTFFSVLRADRAVGKLVETLTAAPQQTLAYGFAGSMKHAAIAAAYDEHPRPLAIVTSGGAARMAGGSGGTAARGGCL